MVDPVTGKITLRLHYPVNPAKPLTGLKCVQFSFYPTDVLEITNPFGVEVMTNKASPRIQQGGAWFFPDPSIKWFDIVDESTPTDLIIEQDGTEVLTKKQRKLIGEYAVDEQVAVPKPVVKNPTNELVLQLAKNHYAEKHA